MYCLSCPYCQKNASSFIRMHTWVPFSKIDKCQNCSNPIKRNISNYYICGFICFIILFISNGLIDLLLSLFGTIEVDSGSIVTVNENNLISVLKNIGELIFVIFIVYLSFELPAKYLGIRIFNKQIEEKDRV
jgi:uncharacterized membrane protein YjgN (DUF898 family)